MIIKNDTITIPEENPFQEDKLGRLECAENLTFIIKNISQPFVLSINSPWGTGKTTFIRMWMQKLENDNLPCLYFNAWENDYFEDPLIPFIGEIQSHIDRFQIERDKKTRLKKYLNKAKGFGAKVIKSSIPIAVIIGTAGVLDLDSFTEQSLSSFAEKLAKEKIEKYEAERKTISSFKSSLQEFADELVFKTEININPLVFFIDELDRCNPTYAISLLERIKHLFNVNGIVFVLSLDKNQIANSIKTRYGKEMDVNGYLRRFIDLHYELPEAPTERFCEYLFNRYGLDEILRKRSLQYRGRENDRKQLLETFVKFSSIFNLSARVQEQSLGLLSIVLLATPNHYNIHPILITFLIALKAKNEPLYNDFRLGKTAHGSVLEYIKTQKGGSVFLNENYSIVLETYLISAFFKWRKDFDEFNESLVTKLKTDTLPNDERDRLTFMAKTLQNFASSDYHLILEFISKKIELNEQFDKSF